MGIGLVTLMGLLCIVPVAAEAQSAEKRSATSGKRGTSSMRRGAAPMRRSMTSPKRSTDSEKKGSLSDEKRGGDSFPDSSRNGSASNRDDGFDDDAYEPEWDSEDGSDGNDDEAAAVEEDFSTRTLGKACMYGVRGEVIFRPAGTRCRGDGPAAPAARSRQMERQVERPKRPNPAKQPQGQEVRRDARSAETAPSGSRGSCIIGIDGNVLYAPAGVDCRR